MNMITRTALAVAAAALALTAAACGSPAPKPAAPAASPATATATQSPTAAACQQLAGGLASLPSNEGPARDAAIRQIAASAAGTPIAAYVSDWRRVVSVSAAAIGRMTQAQATDLALKEAQVVGEIHAACLTAGVSGVMGN